jgi:hypothetical protein
MPDSKPHHFDRRTLDRYVTRGEVTEKDVEKFIKALPDLADEAIAVECALEQAPKGTN